MGCSTETRGPRILQSGQDILPGEAVHTATLPGGMPLFFFLPVQKGQNENPTSLLFPWVHLSGTFSVPGTTGRLEQASQELISYCGQRPHHGELLGCARRCPRLPSMVCGVLQSKLKHHLPRSESTVLTSGRGSPRLLPAPMRLRSNLGRLGKGARCPV